MSMIEIKNVRVLDPIHQTDEVRTVWVENGKLLADAAGQDISQRIDGQGKWLMPALVDLCARLREPGQQQHGTLKTEGQAARAAGFLHVILPPDTKPVQDNGALLRGLREKAFNDGGIYLHIIGAQTKGLEGNQPANMASLKQGGCIAVSNVRAAFADDDVLLRTLEYAASLGLKVFFYPEEHSLAKDGYVHDGFTASRQGLTGIPAIAETVALAKQLLMVEATGVQAHFSLLSCGASVELIKAAKAKGLPVTADVAMHQLHLTDETIDGFNALAHVRPPLRSEADRELLRQGVASGVIDAICSHHEPLSASAKLAPFAETEPGISNIDTFMALAAALVHQDLLTPLQLASRISQNPAKIAGIESQWQEIGGWVLVDPKLEWVVSNDQFQSQGKNTPFLGAKVKGKVEQLLA
ncbi:dihydroorotase [Alkanindiges illinoisensis]|uniref:Aspartate carbamoyltransferase n=1 Tax=Alkanindiges illinoisensis TaxID=197183 RepID=A0A4Y7XBG1_9GAMM|nr:dihydroorotase [Alkanindiges illinoisensis]TEU26136.1 aspartate carbamoyltransferase [Alkanindiges illinoisensis]